MRLLTFVALLVLLPASVFAQAPPAAGPGVPQTDEEKTLYAVGLVMARSLRQFDMSPAEVEFVRRAIADALAGKPAVELDEWGPKIQALVNERGVRLVAREKEAAAAYVAKAAAAAGAVKTESGIVYTETTAGTGASPTAADRVKVHYRGTLINGTEFDSSYSRNEPAVFPLGGVIRCWTEGVQKMRVGGKARLLCPSDVAYGDRGNEAIPGGAALIFEIELLEIVAAPGN
ncbi:MAG TPA: FKBP-type peptidyl-prolyl cis-trans isomerase [Vicinamibacterales bacterium]|nr:FKBP-type peptidyl-prolyl cis-trans isomerase [Vicinamibacterales bacterium]